MRWMPIETAPRKNCEPVLLIDEGNYYVGYWISSPPMWIEPGAGRITPTHWMPLPPPPQETEGGEA